jgi:hypothetical protein
MRLGNHILEPDAGYRRELRAWTMACAQATQGVPATGFGTEPDGRDPPLRNFAAAMPWFTRARETFGPEAWLLLSTESDDARAWLAVGQAAQRVLLKATLLGIAGSFMTSAFEVPDLRRRIAELMNTARAPQLLLRLGVAEARAAAGRRPLDEMVSVGSGVAQLLVRLPAGPSS